MELEFEVIYNRFYSDYFKRDFIKKSFKHKDILPMWTADMDFLVPGGVMELIKKRDEQGVSGYIENMPDSYCEAISAWLHKRHRWDVQAGWMSYAPGIVPALCIAVLAYTEQGDRIAVQSPVYPTLYTIIKSNYRELVANPLKLVNGRYEMDFDDLESKMKTGLKAIIMCSPHNPVGRVWTTEELTRLGDLCLKYKVLVISDEIHSDIVFSGHKHVPIASVSKSLANNTVTCIAPSNAFGAADLNISTIIIPNAELRDKYRNTFKSLGLEPGNTLGITVSEAGYRFGEKWLEYMVEYVYENLQAVKKYISHNIPGIKVINPEGTYLVWLDCRELGYDTEELPGFMLHEAKIGLGNGLAFGNGGEGFLKMNIACPRAAIMEGLRRIGYALGKSSELLKVCRSK